MPLIFGLFAGGGLIAAYPFYLLVLHGGHDRAGGARQPDLRERKGAGLLMNPPGLLGGTEEISRPFGGIVSAGRKHTFFIMHSWQNCAAAVL